MRGNFYCKRPRRALAGIHRVNRNKVAEPFAFPLSGQSRTADLGRQRAQAGTRDGPKRNGIAPKASAIASRMMRVLGA
jgi:hypothetical protein